MITSDGDAPAPRTAGEEPSTPPAQPSPAPPPEALSPDMVAALVRAIELKDGATAAHTWRVVLYTRAIAEAAGLDHDFIARLTAAAALHDLGKIDIPDNILRKPGPLTQDEFEIIKTHADLGHARLLRMGVTDPVYLDLVRHHHERIDGRGYPDGLAGDAVPPVARFFAVVDTFDALTSVRPYRHDLGEDAAKRAIDILREGEGTQYCRDAVRLFADLYNSGRMHWILHYFNDDIPAKPFASSGSLADSLRDTRSG